MFLDDPDPELQAVRIFLLPVGTYFRGILAYGCCIVTCSFLRTYNQLILTRCGRRFLCSSIITPIPRFINVFYHLPSALGPGGPRWC